MAVVTMKNLLDSGVHFGHRTQRWNPKMKRFIFTERNGIYIIDLQQTLSYIDRAYEFVKETVAHGGTVLFIGTKKQAQEAIAEQSTRVGMPYVNQRWLGGMLTNFSTVYKRLQRLKELEAMEANGWEGTATKKEQLILTREKVKLERTLGGIREMSKTPSAVWIVDTKKEHLAVAEAHKLNIPVIAILDTNCDPDEVDYKIPGNDDAIRSSALLTRVIADAVAEGLMARAGLAANAGRDDKPEPGVLATDEPLADWETELLKPTEVAAEPAAAAATETAQPAEAQTETAQPAEAQTETAQPAEAQTETAQPAEAQTETAQPAEAETETETETVTETAQPAEAQTETAQPAEAQTETATEAGSENAAS
jgi:small subunit ribosomal protein S2